MDTTFFNYLLDMSRLLHLIVLASLFLPMVLIAYATLRNR